MGSRTFHHWFKKINASRFLILLCISVFLLSLYTPVVMGLSAEQRKLLNKGIYYYDLTSCVGGGSGGVELIGSENAEKVFNFFIAKGYKPFQAAGIIGNMAVESGVEPQRLQGTPPGTKTPAETFSGSAGWGIVQWTPGSKMIDTFNPKSEANDLGNQLEFLWKQLEGGGPLPEKQAGDDLKSTTNMPDAVLAFQGNQKVGGKYFGFERPEDQSGTVSIRTDAAKAALAKYGSGSAGGSTGASDDSACGEDEGGSSTSAFNGTAQEAAKFLLSKKGIVIYDDKDMIQQMADGQNTPLSEKLIKMLAGLAKNHTFGISSLYRGPCSGSNHCTGNAADINPSIDGVAISYTEYNRKIQAFIDDAARLAGGNCENGVPNQGYVDKTKANGSKCEVFVDRGTGAHVHLAVSSG